MRRVPCLLVRFSHLSGIGAKDDPPRALTSAVHHPLVFKGLNSIPASKRDKTGAETIVLNTFKLLAHTTQIAVFVPGGGHCALARLLAQEQGPHTNRITSDRFCTEMGQD